MHNKLLILGLTLLVIPASMSARARRGNADNYHFGYISGAAGYSSLSHNMDDVATNGDFSFLVGAGYEFRHTSFWLSVGAQYLQEKATLKLNQVITLENGIDDQGRVVKYYKYDINQADEQVLHTIDVPIMLGYYYEGFYVGAGAKVGFDIGSKVNVNGGYELSAQYQRTMEEFHSVKYYTNYELPTASFDCNLRPQFSLLGEIGYDLLSSLSTKSSICHVLKLGFYFEYGLRSIRGEEAMDPISINGATIDVAREKQYDVRKTTLNPYCMSAATVNKYVVPFFVGAKLTYMIGGNRYATGTWHKGCMCYQ